MKLEERPVVLCVRHSGKVVLGPGTQCLEGLDCHIQLPPAEVVGGRESEYVCFGKGGVGLRQDL